MPVSFIKDAIIDNLSKVGYTVQDIESPSIRDTFKESLILGDTMQLSILSNREFEVKLSENSYSQIMATDFYYSFQKVVEQSNFLKSSQAQKAPLAWLLVSAYYSAFYSAIELSKLFGIYNLYLKKDHCHSIISHASGSSKLDRGNYIGVVNKDAGDYVTIRFTSRESVPPHDLAWKNILKILEFHKMSDVRPTKLESLKFLKSILNSSNSLLQTPNNVRNDWNYSYANAYDNSFSSEISLIKTFLSDKGRANVMSFPTTYKRNSIKQNSAYSVIYIEAILRQSMFDLNKRLFNE